MTSVRDQVEDWHRWMQRAYHYDLWGQPVEASECYSRLASVLRWEVSQQVDKFTDSLKKSLNKISSCLELRCRDLHNPQTQPSITLDDMSRVSTYLGDLLSTSPDDFPVLVTPNLSSHMSLSTHGISVVHSSSLSDDDSNEYNNDMSHSSLLPPPQVTAGQTAVTVRVLHIAMKDAASYLDSFITVSVKDALGCDIGPQQDTPTATHKVNSDIIFNTDVHIQQPLELLPKGFCIFFEFKHYKPNKKKISTKCWTFLEQDELLESPLVLELYKKPSDGCRKKIRLLTVKPLYLHIKIIYN